MRQLTDQQRLFFVESEQLYEAWQQALTTHRQYRYGMRWLKSGGQEYLLRLTDAKRNGRSLGPRSPETEAIYAAFSSGKTDSGARLKKLTQRIKEQARLNRAIRLGRVPTVVAEILGALNDAGVGSDFRVVGTHALFGYEAMAAVHCDMDVLATSDADLLFDSRKRLSLIAKRLDAQGIVGILRRVDQSFALVRSGSFRAVNQDGFMVDLIGAPTGIRHNESVQLAQDDSLEWLANSPRVEAIAIASNGMPVRLSLCDPRAFTLHKAWLSQQPDREPVKKRRDFAQAALLVEMICAYLPQYPFSKDALRYMPAQVRKQALALLAKESDLRLPGMDY